MSKNERRISIVSVVCFRVRVKTMIKIGIGLAMMVKHTQQHHDNIRPSLITLDSPYISYGVTVSRLTIPYQSFIKGKKL